MNRENALALSIPIPYEESTEYLATPYRTLMEEAFNSLSAQDDYSDAYFDNWKKHSSQLVNYIIHTVARGSATAKEGEPDGNIHFMRLGAGLVSVQPFTQGKRSGVALEAHLKEMGVHARLIYDKVKDPDPRLAAESEIELRFTDEVDPNKDYYYKAEIKFGRVDTMEKMTRQTQTFPAPTLIHTDKVDLRDINFQHGFQEAR